MIIGGLFLIITIIPIPFLEKISHYMTMMLMITVQLTILQDILPSSAADNKTKGEEIVMLIFFMASIITLSTLIVQIFTDDSMKPHRLP